MFKYLPRGAGSSNSANCSARLLKPGLFFDFAMTKRADYSKINLCDRSDARDSRYAEKIQWVLVRGMEVLAWSYVAKKIM